MLDPALLRAHPESVRRGVRAKRIAGAEAALDDLLLLDEEHRLLRQELEELQARRNAGAKRIGAAKRAGEDASEAMREVAGVSAEAKRLEERERALRDRIDRLRLEIPNVPHESVPDGAGPQDNVVVHEREGIAPLAEPEPHWAFLTRKGWLDLEAGARVTGAGFPVLRGDGVRLVRALEAFFLARLAAAGYEEVRVPLLANEASATATGQLPDKEGQMYRVDDGLYLIPTSEVVVTNLYRDAILDEDALPLRICASTPCFRREAGSHGKEVRGLNRVHQFDKVEMVVFSPAAASYDELELMTELAEGLLDELGLRYRRLSMCSGDMGFTQAKKYDLEAYAPGQDRWLEVSSVSNLTDFQARRMRTRARPGGPGGKGRPEPVHTLNGSALALPRTVAALVETYRTEDDVVQLPDALRPFVGGDRLG